MNLSQAFAVLLLAAVASVGEAADWRYSVGVHDFIVADVDSHTYGINGGVSMDQRTDAGRHLFGSFDIFWDRDKDHLDPDHIPIWWQLHLGSDGDFWRGSRTHLGWTADINTRINTASSIERQITALPAIVAGYDGTLLQASLQAGAGWFLLHIDDDAPRERGYDRSELRNSTLAYAVTANVALKLGDSWTISAWARRWWDRDGWLENQYTAALRVDTSRWIAGKQSELVLSADYTQYNLAVYNHPTGLSVLPWNDDLLIRLSLETRW
jgi:hypothetical protein